MKRFFKNNNGFTFVELMVVLVILAIALGLFYTTFYYNWVMMETYTSRANLMQDADLIIEELTADTRNSFDADITCPAPNTNCVSTATSVNFAVNTATGGNRTTAINYVLGADGSFTKQVGATIRILSSRIDFNNTSFQKVEGALRVRLTLTEPLAGPDTKFETWTDIFPRWE